MAIIPNMGSGKGRARRAQASSSATVSEAPLQSGVAEKRSVIARLAEIRETWTDLSASMTDLEDLLSGSGKSAKEAGEAVNAVHNLIDQLSAARGTLAETEEDLESLGEVLEEEHHVSYFNAPKQLANWKGMVYPTNGHTLRNGKPTPHPDVTAAEAGIEVGQRYARDYDVPGAVASVIVKEIVDSAGSAIKFRDGKDEWATARTLSTDSFLSSFSLAAPDA